MRRFLRACAWMVAWVLLFLAALAIALALSNGWRVEPYLIVVAITWYLPAILSMAWLSRTRRLRARWLLVGFLLLASRSGQPAP